MKNPVIMQVFLFGAFCFIKYIKRYIGVLRGNVLANIVFEILAGFGLVPGANARLPTVHRSPSALVILWGDLMVAY